MITRFDHAVIAVRDLEDATRRYRDLGFDVRSGGRHVGLGTRNALIRFGLDYIELIAVDDAVQARAAGQTALVDYLAAGPGGFAGFALATDDIEADAERFRTAAVPVLGPFAMQRVRPDGNLLSWRLLVPYGAVWRRPWPFLIQWDQPDEQRLAWESVGPHPNGARSVAGLSLIARDLASTISLWRDGLQQEVEAVSPERAVVRLDARTIDLTAAQRPHQDEGEGIAELRIEHAAGRVEPMQLPTLLA